MTTLTIASQPPPLRTDALGTIRVGNTRVSLDVVIMAFKAGASAEEIVHRFPTLDLGDVYAVIGFYLHNETAVDAYLAAQEQDADAIRKQIEARQHPDALRARLLSLRAQHEP